MFYSTRGLRCGVPLPDEVVESDPLPLSEIFNFADSLFEVVEFPLPVDVVESPLPDVVGVERVDENRSVQIDAVNSVSLTKTTRESPPDRVHFYYFMFVVFLYVTLAWCVVFSWYLLSAEVLLFSEVSDAGRQAVQWNLSSREELPKDFFLLDSSPQGKDRQTFSRWICTWRIPWRMKTLYSDLWSIRRGGGGGEMLGEYLSYYEN